MLNLLCMFKIKDINLFSITYIFFLFCLQQTVVKIASCSIVSSCQQQQQQVLLQQQQPDGRQMLMLTLFDFLELSFSNCFVFTGGRSREK